MDCQNFDTEYRKSLDWLYSQLPMFSRVGAAAYKPGLDNTLRLDDIYGHPHRGFKTIHIAGTNGKGSSSHMIAAALQAQGYKTGLYTSPHLVDFRERMRINGEMIPRERVAEFVEDWRKRQRDLRPSFFELTMMMAFDWFNREKVDYAVIEVGMGGRLDSTNIISPEVCVITNISFDHTQFLGNTLEEIAAEKAGIMKPGVPVVIGEAEGSIRTVFEEKAKETGASIYFADEYGGIKAMERSDGKWNCTLADGEVIRVPLAGSYQKKNIRTVLCALSVMKKRGIALDEANIKEGLENVAKLTGLRGRWERRSENPTVVCDTGHNVAGITDNMRTLREVYGNRKVKFVVGFVNDKDISHIVELFPSDARYYFTQASIPRALAAGKVAQYFKGRGICGEVIPDVKEAVRAALNDASPDDVIYVGGSTFVVADFLAE